MKNRIHTQTKQGSTIVITLVYMTIMLLIILGASYTLTRLLQSNRFISDNIQAGYNAESGLELAFLELRLRREGYENTVADFPAPDDLGSIGYNIDFKSTAKNSHFVTPTDQEIDQHTLAKGIKKLALFHDDGSNIVSYFPTPGVSGGIQLLTPNLSSDIADCIEVKLSGINSTTGSFETISSQANCRQSTSTIDILSLSGEKRYAVSDGFTLPTQTFKDFLHEHKEVYLLLRNTRQSASSLPFQLQVDKQIASIDKKIVSEGVYKETTVKKIAFATQDQIPELLSAVIIHK